MTDAALVETSSWLRRHWFVPLAVLIALVDVTVAVTAPWPNAVIEAAIAVDLAVIMPAAYAICYRRGGRRTILRTIALACLGIWLASTLVPGEHHVLEDLRWLRYAGLAVLVAIEIRIVVGVYRAIFRRGSTDDDARDAATRAGMPPALAKLVALEARMWRRVIGWFRRS